MNFRLQLFINRAEFIDQLRQDLEPYEIAERHCIPSPPRAAAPAILPREKAGMKMYETIFFSKTQLSNKLVCAEFDSKCPNIISNDSSK